MRRAVLISGLVAVTTSSRGDPAPPAPPPAPVNLMSAVPTVVAVSSTVANRTILPAHLVDGDLGTAWNSRTGELQGAWIGARVPAGARVTKIRMTVGFTKIDPKLGDLFTMNPRIRKVRVLHDGVAVVEQALDPALRTLQDIRIDQPGGEYKIEVVDIVPGTKKSWREISVSELEIWGTLAAGAAPNPSVPVVRVGSFDAPPAIAKADCVAAMFPTAKGEKITTAHGVEDITVVEAIALSADLAVCRVEHTRERTERWSPGLMGEDGIEATLADTTIEVAPVTRTPRLAAGERIAEVTNTEIRDLKFPPSSNGIGDMDHEAHTVVLTVVPLTATENALLADVTERRWGSGMHHEATASTLYRIERAGLAAILSFNSSADREHDSQLDSSDRCQLVHLVPPKPPSAMPPTLTLACEHTENASGGPRGGRAIIRSSTVRYRWTGTQYEQQ